MSDPFTVTRFAPSPTGRLHLGHVHSALFGWRVARAARGRFLLRMEDIDPGRCRSEFEDGIYEDLAWLGLDWETPVRRQSEHLADYVAARRPLEEAGLLYPCFCTRKDIAAEIARSGHAPHGPEGPLYPGICRDLDRTERAERIAAGEPYALRLDMAQAVRIAGPLAFTDRAVGRVAADPRELGDVVLARKDVPTSYHLSVALDDALQGVTLVTRGTDLFHATPVHRLLQVLLGMPEPEYHHHRLLTDARGRRFAKRNRAATVAALRAAGHAPADVRAMAGFPN